MNGCATAIADSIWTSGNMELLGITDTSSACSFTQRKVDAGPASNFPFAWQVILNGWSSFRMVARGQYYVNSNLKREAYKSVHYRYTSANNYGSCSADFEFEMISGDSTGQRMLFTAMNDSALSYSWQLFGLGNVNGSSDTISYFYPYDPNDLWFVCLAIEGPAGCRDTVYQNIIVRKNIPVITTVDDIRPQDNFTLFPNPFQDEAVLESDLQARDLEIEIYDLSGQLVRTTTYSSPAGRIIIKREDLPAGLYMFVLKADGVFAGSGKFGVI